MLSVYIKSIRNTTAIAMASVHIHWCPKQNYVIVCFTLHGPACVHYIQSRFNYTHGTFTLQTCSFTHNIGQDCTNILSTSQPVQCIYPSSGNRNWVAKLTAETNNSTTGTWTTTSLTQTACPCWWLFLSLLTSMSDTTSSKFAKLSWSNEVAVNSYYDAERSNTVAVNSSIVRVKQIRSKIRAVNCWI